MRPRITAAVAVVFCTLTLTIPECSMALPYTRELTVQLGQPVPAWLVNRIQDSLVTIATTRALVWRQARHPSAATSAASNMDGDVQLGNPGDYLVELPLDEGERLRTVRVVASTLAGATLTVGLYRRSYAAAAPAQSRVQIGATQTWPPNDVEVRRQIDVVAAVPPDGEDIVLQDDSGDPTDTSYWLYFANSGGTAKLHTVKVLVEARAVAP